MKRLTLRHIGKWTGRVLVSAMLGALLWAYSSVLRGMWAEGNQAGVYVTLMATVLVGLRLRSGAEYHPEPPNGTGFATRQEELCWQQAEEGRLRQQEAEEWRQKIANS